MAAGESSSPCLALLGGLASAVTGVVLLGVQALALVAVAFVALIALLFGLKRAKRAAPDEAAEDAGGEATPEGAAAPAARQAAPAEGAAAGEGVTAGEGATASGVGADGRRVTASWGPPVASAGTDLRCRYCRRGSTPEEAVACPACDAAYHPACAERMGGCVSLGCQVASADRARRREAASDTFVVPTQAPSAEQQCPFCRDELVGPLELAACPDCETIYHRECLAEMDRCATVGCHPAAGTRRLRT